MRRLLFIVAIFSFCLGQQTYDSEIQPIWDANCTSCHGSSGNLDLSQGVSYSNIVNVASSGYSGFLLVKPNDPMNSVMHQKIVGNSSFGDRMPKNGTKLSTSDESKIMTWIQNGAPQSWNSSTQSYSFDFGPGARILVDGETIEGKSKWSLEYWVKFHGQSTSSNGNLFFMNNSANENLFLAYVQPNEKTFRIEIKESNTMLFLDTPIDDVFDQNFHHFYMEGDGTKLRLYVDGFEKMAVDFSGNFPSSDKNIEVGEVVKEEEVNIDELQERKAPKRKYQLPSSDLLEMPIKIQEGMSKDELVDRANFLTQSLETFGVVGKVVNVSPGPVITLFEVEPAEGVRVNKFVQLSDDLARVMEASRVRVIAPIPGKSSVGIEIPNKDPDTVFFRSIINSEKFAESDAELTLAIGKTTSGEISTLNLAKMPHLLIAGTTGSGKSVCLNTIICSLLYNSTPEELKFVIVDPKKVEMTLYKSLKGYHLLGMEDFEESIVTKPDNATLALRAVEKEMSRRYDTLADAVVRNIQEYNAKKVASSEEIMPYIVVVVDELADLMMLNAKEVEQPIARLAQLARAVGIHLVIATQRPSVDVITGLIKANFPSRIAFQVASKIDSRTILDMPGAEKLIGRGDMLYLGSGSSEPVRLHNAFLSINEVEAIMDHILSQPKSEELVLESVREQTTIDADSGDNAEGDDELLNEAIKLVIIHQQGSISLIQRRMKVGYSRAARLIDRMEQLGVVGSFTGSKAREVMVDETYLEMINDD